LLRINTVRWILLQILLVSKEDKGLYLERDSVVFINWGSLEKECKIFRMFIGNLTPE
jgi:hypothetical protein